MSGTLIPNTGNRGKNADNKDATRVILTEGGPGDTPPTLSAELEGAQNPTIYNLSVTANVQSSQAITDGTKMLFLKPREAATIKLSYDNGFTDYITIPKGNSFDVSGLDTLSLTLYLECDKTTIIEIEQWA